MSKNFNYILESVLGNFYQTNMDHDFFEQFIKPHMVYDYGVDINIMSSKDESIFAVRTDKGEQFISGKISSGIEYGYINKVFYIQDCKVYVWEK